MNKLAQISEIYLATLNRRSEDAGSKGTIDNTSLLNVTINIDGDDVVDENINSWFPNGSGSIIKKAIVGIAHFPVTPFETDDMTNSSIRVGIKHTDAWGPRDVLVMGANLGAGVPPFPLAIAMDIDIWLSGDPQDDAHLTMPIPLVRLGNERTLIRRVLLLIGTEGDVRGTNDQAGTNDPIELSISVGGNPEPVFTMIRTDTSQEDLEKGSANWYEQDVEGEGFTLLDVLTNGGIKLRLLGRGDAWLPKMVFVFGLDTNRSQGHPDAIVKLVSKPFWVTRGDGSPDYMSVDSNEDPLQGIRDLL
jgi:hypothetical protein